MIGRIPSKHCIPLSFSRSKNRAENSVEREKEDFSNERDALSEGNPKFLPRSCKELKEQYPKILKSVKPFCIFLAVVLLLRGEEESCKGRKLLL